MNVSRDTCRVHCISSVPPIPRRYTYVQHFVGMRACHPVPIEFYQDPECPLPLVFRTLSPTLDSLLAEGPSINTDYFGFICVAKSRGRKPLCGGNAAGFHAEVWQIENLTESTTMTAHWLSTPIKKLLLLLHLHFCRRKQKCPTSSYFVLSIV